MTQTANQRPTIVDVAHRAGVSKSTVARALSDASNINPDTRKKVLDAARWLGYERNHLAHSLRSGRTGMLGLVIPDIANTFWAEVARGAQDRAAEQGASLLVFSSDWDPTREANHLRALRQARVDGAIVNPVEDSVDDLGQFGVPLVLIGSSAERFPDLPSVGSDIAQGVIVGLDHLFSLGHRRMALLLGSPRRLARARFLRLVHDYFVAHDRDPASLQIEEGDYTVQSGRQAMARLLADPAGRPQAVFAANDLMALGALLAVREAGLRCPQDVSILGFDDIAASVFSDPALSTIAKPARQIGRTGMDMLLGSISGQGSGGQIVLPCQLQARGSTQAVDSAASPKLSALG